MWHLHFSFIFHLCQNLKPIVEMTLNDRIQDAEKCILSIHVHNPLKPKVSGISANQCTGLGAGIKFVLKKKENL